MKDFGRTLKQEKVVMDSLKNMIDTVESVVQSSKDKSLSLDKAEEIISSLKVTKITESFGFGLSQSSDFRLSDRC